MFVVKCNRKLFYTLKNFQTNSIASNMSTCAYHKDEVTWHRTPANIGVHYGDHLNLWLQREPHAMLPPAEQNVPGIHMGACPSEREVQNREAIHEAENL